MLILIFFHQKQYHRLFIKIKCIIDKKIYKLLRLTDEQQ